MLTPQRTRLLDTLQVEGRGHCSLKQSSSCATQPAIPCELLLVHKSAVLPCRLPFSSSARFCQVTETIATMLCQAAVYQVFLQCSALLQAPVTF